MTTAPRYPGIRVTANGNQLVSYHTEIRIAETTPSKVSRVSPIYCATLVFAKYDSQAVEDRYRQPASTHFYSSESSQHISRNKNRNINGRTRNSEVV